MQIRKTVTLDPEIIKAVEQIMQMYKISFSSAVSMLISIAIKQSK